MQVKLLQLDGKLPNLAIMKLAHWHLGMGNQISLRRNVQPQLWDKPADLVYASAIFEKTQPKIEELTNAYPDATTGGSGIPEKLALTVESLMGLAPGEYEHYDYSLYPEYRWSIGFTQRGCRLRCGFCIVPKKEGKPVPVNTINDIWRTGYPKNIVLLDNDFFGQPKEEWLERARELKEGEFKVCFSQGINVRLIDEEGARILAKLRYHNSHFDRRRLYTAWDNLGQERIVLRGLDMLNQAGIPPKHVMVYMLTGYADGETMGQVMERFKKLREKGYMPYPMVYDPSNKTLKAFQRWVIGRYHQFISWEDFRKGPGATEEE